MTGGSLEQAGSSDPTHGARLRRLSGGVGPRAQALKNYEQRRQQVPSAVGPALANLMLPEPAVVYRWRVQLSCGCVQGALTFGEDRFPDDEMYDCAGARLPKGQMACRAGHKTTPTTPYRSVEAWHSRTVTEYPADPVEPPAGCNDAAWSALRECEPCSMAPWTATLSCGHIGSVPAPLDWDPSQPPRRLSTQQLQLRVQNLEKYLAACPADTPDAVATRDHWLRMLGAGWPEPRTEIDCWTCTVVHQIEAYDRIGPLAYEPTPPTKAHRRAKLEQRLQDAEDEAARLRRQLGDLS